MNQILLTNNKNRKKYNGRFKLIFFLSLLFMCFFITYFLFFHYEQNKKENFSNTLLSTLNIQRLYSENDYTTISLNEENNFLVLGSISIPSIDIEYPILSETTDEFLKIAPCRFYGPYPNQVGNLCIAAHNYDDNRFFSNLNKLNIGDEIKISDYTGDTISYYVYEKYEINENDTSCTSQDTNGKKEITLVTCNNLNGNRLIVKAKE